MTTIAEALASAIEHHRSGRLDAAEKIYQQVLEVEPDNPDALHLLGVIASAAGKLEIAVGYMRKALESKPDNAFAYYNLGNALMKQGNVDDAAACFRQALALAPEFALAHGGLGLALSDQGKLDEAVACCRRAVALKPDFAEAHNNLGVALKKQGKVMEAATCYREALTWQPDFAEAHNNLGVALGEQGKLDEAVACYRRALALKPDYVDAHYNLGVAWKDQGNLDEAIQCHQRALHLKPDYAAAHSDLGIALSGQGKLDEAITCYQRALALKPDFAEGHNNLGNALKQQGKLHDAIACNQRALTFKPDYADARLNQSLLMLLRGDYERGWTEYEWRWQTKPQSTQRRHSSQPLWDGQHLEGRTILVHAEQGLGDTIQFVRYLPLVKERGGAVVFECQPALVPLLSGNVGTDQVIAAGTPVSPFDVQAPLLSLPGILGTRLDTIPANIPYLHCDARLVERWRKELVPLGGFKVGVTWQGNSSHASDRYRSFPLTQLARLAGVEGVRLVRLQKGPGTRQLTMAKSSQALSILDYGDRLDAAGAFLDTAAILMNLDLVITVDSAVAHLAGALGVPVWLALSIVPDWRWLLDRADTPWYPTMRLFRQSRPGDWDEVFERIAQKLTQVVTAGKEQ